MKKIIVLFNLLIFMLCYSQNMNASDIYDYAVLQNVNDIQTYSNLIGRTFYYVPPKSKSSYSAPFQEWEYLGYDVQKVTLTSVEGKYKPKKAYQVMQWTIKTEDGKTKSFTVYSGNYNKYTGLYSYTITEIPFYDYEKWKSDNSAIIGKVFTNSLVKAQYKVVDFSYGKNVEKYKSSYDKDYVTVLYTVENSVTGEKHIYNAASASNDCFEEDLSGSYISTLSKVEKPSNSAIKYGKTTVVTDEKNKNINKYSYKDNYIDIVIYGTSEQFYFTLTNVSSFTEKLVWDEAAFVDYSGKTSRVMHSGIRYSERDASMPESTIIKGASLEDIACPTSNVYYSDVSKDWRTKSMYPSHPSKETKQVRLMLPIKIKGVVNEYTFIFNINYVYKHPDRLNL